MVVEFDDDVIVVAREYGAEPEFSMLDLGTLGECRFACHDSLIPLYTIVTIWVNSVDIMVW